MEEGREGTANTALNEKAVIAEKTEPFENCTLILSHTFKKDVPAEIRPFREGGLRGLGCTHAETMPAFSTGAQELSQ